MKSCKKALKRLTGVALILSMSVTYFPVSSLAAANDLESGDSYVLQEDVTAGSEELLEEEDFAGDASTIAEDIEDEENGDSYVPDATNDATNDAINDAEALDATAATEDSFESPLDEETQDYTYSVTSDEATITKYKGTDIEVVIPDELGGYPVVAIGLNAFFDNNDIISVKMPDTITTVGVSSFYGCKNLSNVELSKNTTTIDKRAFSYCTSLESITFPDGLITIGSEAFGYAENLGEVYIPSSVQYMMQAFDHSAKKITFAEGFTEIPTNACYDANYAHTIVLPDTVKTINNGAFCGCTKLVNINIPSGVEYIGESAFASCKSLKEITLPEGLETIGYMAFGDCGLQEITIPSTVSYFGKKAFGSSSAKKIIFAEGFETIPNNACYEATKLETVELPSTLKKIGAEAFYGCEKLSELPLPEGLEYIERYAFNGTSSLNEVILPSSLNYIGAGAFKNSAKKIVFAEGTSAVLEYACSYANLLEEVVIPETVTEIQKNAFSDCTNLKTVVLPAALKKINSYAFEYCSSLESIELPDGLTIIGTGAFRRDYALTEIVIPSSVRAIWPEAFEYSIKKITFAEGTTEIVDSACDGATYLEEAFFPDNITRIGNSAFYGTNLKSFVIPKTVTYLGVEAFGLCKNLEEISLPVTLERIDSQAFLSGPKKIIFEDGWKSIPDSVCYSASNATEIIIPDSVTSIGDKAFFGCSKLTSIELPRGVRKIGQEAFYCCKALKEITIPSVVDTIGENAFKESITKITFADGMITIPASACYGANKLLEVVLPDSATMIGNNAFYNCAKLKDVTLPGNLETIGDGAFYNARFTQLSIPDSVTEIGNNAFASCSVLAELTLSKNLVKLGDKAFYYDVYLTEISLPEGLKVIGAEAFSNCARLTSVVIPASVETIGEKAFDEGVQKIVFAPGTKKIPANAFEKHYAIKEVEIPDGVTEIGERTFYDCVNLEKINLPEGIVSIGASAFEGVTKTKIFIPDSLTEMGEDAFKNCIVAKTCGDDAEWVLDYPTMTATITGTGVIGNNGKNIFGPFEDMVQFVQIDGENTEIAAGSFAGMDELLGVVLGDTVKIIGKEAFKNCSKLIRVELSRVLQKIGVRAFYGCTSLQAVIFRGSFPDIADTAFPDISFYIYYPKSNGTYTEYVKAEYSNKLTWAPWDDTLPSRDIVLLLDVSDSMEGAAIASLRNAVCAFADKVGGRLTNTRIGIVTYSTKAKRLLSFTTDVEKIKLVTQGIETEYLTYYMNAFNEGQNLIDESNASVKSVILFSDGIALDSDKNALVQRAQQFRDDGIYTYCVGLYSTDAHRQLLIDIAGKEENYFEATDINALIGQFVQLSEEIGRSGECGDNVRWNYVGDKNALVLSVPEKIPGNGVMNNYSQAVVPEWEFYKNSIEDLYINKGVTYVGEYSFSNLWKLDAVQIDKSVQAIGKGAFGNESSLRIVYYLGTEAEWNQITIGEDNDALKNANITFAYENPDPDEPVKPDPDEPEKPDPDDPDPYINFDKKVVAFTETYTDPYEGLTYNEKAERYEVVYTGSAIEPKIVVATIKTELVEGTDYTVSYANNTNVDTKGNPAQVIVTYMGEYEGEKTLDFYIIPADFEVLQSSKKLEVSDPIKVDKGKKINPVITCNGKTLKASDYSASNIYIEKDEVKLDVTGRGNYCGTISGITVEFKNAKDKKKIINALIIKP